jgi:uncharacterized Zn finger protein
MSYGQPEIEQTPPCPHCAARAVFRAIARPGERERPVFLRCCQCGHERADLEFYEQSAA